MASLLAAYGLSGKVARSSCFGQRRVRAVDRRRRRHDHVEPFAARRRPARRPLRAPRGCRSRWRGASPRDRRSSAAPTAGRRGARPRRHRASRRRAYSGSRIVPSTKLDVDARGGSRRCRSRGRRAPRRRRPASASTRHRFAPMKPAPPVTTTLTADQGTDRYRASVPRLFLSPPDVGARERALLLEAFDSNWIAPLGPHVDAFEQEFAEIARRRRGGGAVERHRRPAPRARAARRRARATRCSCLTLTFVAAGQRGRLRGRPAGVRRQRRRHLEPRPGARRGRARRARLHVGRDLPAALIGVDLYGQCADYEPILGVVRELRGPARSRTRPRRSARPTGAGRRGRSARSACSRSTATRSSPPAAAGCSCPTTRR